MIQGRTGRHYEAETHREDGPSGLWDSAGEVHFHWRRSFERAALCVGKLLTDPLDTQARRGGVCVCVCVKVRKKKKIIYNLRIKSLVHLNNK